MYPETGEMACRYLERTYSQPFTKTVPIGVGAISDFVKEVSEIVEINGRYAIKRFAKGMVTHNELITTFTIEPLDCVFVHNEGERLKCNILVDNCKFPAELASDCWHTLREFRKEIAKFVVGQSITAKENDLQKLRHYVFQQKGYKTSTGLKVCGFHNNTFVTDQGSLSKEGEDNSVVYLPIDGAKISCSLIDVNLEEMTQENLDDFKEHLHKFNEEYITLSVLGWASACFYKDIIHDVLGKFPILVLEGGAGSVGILLEFAVANKMTAAARGLSLFKGGKNLNQILNAAKGKKFYNGKKAMTVAQTKAAAAKAGMGHRTWLLANGYDKSVKAGALSRIGVVTTEALIEGAKFAALPSAAGNRGDSFATGFGFGAAGQILGPALGTIKASSFSKNAPAWLPNAAPRLEKIYNLGFKGPLNFVVGSEVGEMGLALTDDLMGYEEFSTFIDEGHISKCFGIILDLGSHQSTLKSSRPVYK